MLDLVVVHALIYILSLAESYLCVCVCVDEMTIFPFRFPHKHFNSTSHQKYPQSRRITYGKNIVIDDHSFH